MRLDHLRPGTRFRLGETEGVVLKVNECRARVRWAGRPRVVEFDSHGQHRDFIADGGRVTDVAPSVDVEVLRDE